MEKAIDLPMRHIVLTHDLLIRREPFRKELLIGLHPQRLPGRAAQSAQPQLALSGGFFDEMGQSDGH